MQKNYINILFLLIVVIITIIIIDEKDNAGAEILFFCKF